MKSKPSRKVFSFFKNTITKIDLFQKPISSVLNESNNQSFQTICGGMVSLAIIIFFTIYVVLSTIEIIKREKIQVQQNIIYSDLTSDGREHQVGSKENGVTLAFNVSTLYIPPGGNYSDYFSINVLQINSTYTFNLEKLNVTSQDLKLEKCSQKHFPINIKDSPFLNDNVNDYL